jgi:hypothetical protein
MSRLVDAVGASERPGDVPGVLMDVARDLARWAGLDDTFEYATKDIPRAETLVAGTRERRMVRNGIFDAELAEPAIGEVHLHFTADQPLRADRKDIPPRPASGSSDPDRSTGDPWTNNEVQVRREARKDREQRRSSAPDDLRELRRLDETRRTVDLDHSSDGPSWIDLAEIRVDTTESRFEGYLN